jgi:prepilin-type N-terminal cleavage/methylation domain-containing protein
MQNNREKIKIQNNKQGFTLIEMMVSVALFAIVMLIGVGALLSLIDANRKAQAINSVMNNLNFAVESISRNLRVGTNYNCNGTGDCSGGKSISFISSEGKAMEYRYNFSNPNWKKIEFSEEGGDFIAITAKEVTIDNFKLYVKGTSPLDNFQPRVVMIIQGTAGVKDNIKTKFNLQTMVSQRILDL